MKYKNVREAVFIARPNRFIAQVEIKGEIQIVHVKNTGRCKELLREGVTVYLEDHENQRLNRKTRYSLISVEKKDRIVNIDSYAPNRVVGEALASGRIELPGFGSGLSKIKPEKTFGSSRFDFYVESCQGQKAYIEVKGVTLEEGGTVRFPDAPTERGVRHIRELSLALEQGYHAYLIFVIQMKGAGHFEPNDETHPAFGEALREARIKGVEVLAYDCEVTPGSIVLSEPVQVRL
jgi:sugar fermentation stimulation protein A